MSRPGRCGFTLMELMVALVVTGVVVLAAHAGLSAVTEHWLKAGSQRRATLAAASARDALTGWLRGAVLLPGAGGLLGRHHFQAGQSRDDLTFVTADGGLLRPGPHRIRLWIGENRSGLPTGLLAEIAPLHDSIVETPDTVVLAPGATGLAIEYLVPAPHGDEWRDAWESGENLPHAIQLQLTRLGAIRLGGSAAEAPELAPLLTLPVVAAVGREEQ